MGAYAQTRDREDSDPKTKAPWSGSRSRGRGSDWSREFERLWQGHGGSLSAIFKYVIVYILIVAGLPEDGLGVILKSGWAWAVALVARDA